MELSLLWTNPQTGEQSTRALPTARPISIGRTAENVIQLDSAGVSKQHALITTGPDTLIVQDRKSRNGTFVNNQRVPAGGSLPLKSGDTLRIGSIDIHIQVNADLSEAVTQVYARDADDDQMTMRLPSGAPVPASNAQPRPVAAPAPARARKQPAPGTHDPWPPACFAQQYVSLPDIRATGLQVQETDYLTFGGMGGFVFTDLLRICGVQPQQILAIGPQSEPHPYGRYGTLCNNSQIPRHERIRSNAESCPDNIWGWPGYALREMWHEFWRGNIGAAWTVFKQVFGEPTLADTYTPRLGDVFASIDREAQRIGWDAIYRYGRMHALRKTDDGRFVIACSQTGADGPPGTRSHTLIVARHVYLATGYPAVKFLPDLQDYRERTGDAESVVNAYEHHEHIYDHLRRHGGTVILRGRGIVASRVLQRIDEVRRAGGPNRVAINVLHLMRTPLREPYRFGRAARNIRSHWEFQPFNWPEGTWGGKYRKLLEAATPTEREKLIRAWEGTTTARRRDWLEIVERGLREGWYKQEFGEVTCVEKNGNGMLQTLVKSTSGVGGILHLEHDFVIDATGLQAEVRRNPVIDDLVAHYALQLNPLERLHVANDFEVPGLRNDPGRVFAAGAITLGGPYAPVDTFLGLQFSALRAVDALNGLGAAAPGIRYLGPIRSFVQFLKWTLGVQPA